MDNNISSQMTIFLKNSAEYSQIENFKYSLLAPLLKTYNEYLLTPKTSQSVKSESFIIPNNNKKFYLCISSKGSNFNQLYFFQDSYSDWNVDLLTQNQHSDFFLEIDKRFNEPLLFEGYLYALNDKYTFLISDILMKNNQVVVLDYPLRYTMLNEIILNTPTLQHLNDHLDISIHPVFPSYNELMVTVFRQNFIFKNFIVALETITDDKKTRHLLCLPNHNKTRMMYIERGAYADVYNVLDKESGNKEGILYIKKISDSKYAKQLFKNKDKIEHACKYNQMFNKWELCVDV